MKQTMSLFNFHEECSSFLLKSWYPLSTILHGALGFYYVVEIGNMCSEPYKIDSKINVSKRYQDCAQISSNKVEVSSISLCQFSAQIATLKATLLFLTTCDMYLVVPQFRLNCYFYSRFALFYYKTTQTSAQNSIQRELEPNFQNVLTFLGQMGSQVSKAN